MKIGLDGVNAVANNGDSGQIKVIETLATDYPQCTLAVYTPKVSRKTRLNLIDSLHNADYHLPAPSGFQGRLWRLFGITNCLQPDKIDVYHGLNGVRLQYHHYWRSSSSVIKKKKYNFETIILPLSDSLN